MSYYDIQVSAYLHRPIKSNQGRRQGQWRSEDVRGPWTTDSPEPLPILHNLIPLTPPHIHPYLDVAHVYLYYMILNTALLISTYLMVYFGNLGPFDDAMGKMGGGPLMTQ